MCCFSVNRLNSDFGPMICCVLILFQFSKTHSPPPQEARGLRRKIKGAYSHSHSRDKSRGTGNKVCFLTMFNSVLSPGRVLGSPRVKVVSITFREKSMRALSLPGPQIFPSGFDENV